MKAGLAHINTSLLLLLLPRLDLRQSSIHLQFLHVYHDRVPNGGGIRIVLTAPEIKNKTRYHCINDRQTEATGTKLGKRASSVAG